MTSNPASVGPAPDGECVYVEVSGLTGSGKSAVLGEIEIAMKALGMSVEHDAAFQSEKNMTHADWQVALDLYRPTVVLRERNIPRAPHPDREAEPTSGITDDMLDRAFEGTWAEQTPEERQAEPTGGVVPMVFGAGRFVVDTGCYQQTPAVFICPVDEPGKVGASARALGHDRHTLLPGEQVMTFPTVAQAQAVADALVGSVSPPVVEGSSLRDTQPGAADDWADLEALAKRCTGGDPWYSADDLRGKILGVEMFIPQDRKFIAAATPATILKLIEAARQSPTEGHGAAVLVPMQAVQRLILAADSYGVRYLDSDDMSDEAVELQAATEAMKGLLSEPSDSPDWQAEAIRAHGFIFDLGCDLHSRRVADWFPEGAHNAADQMSEDMRLLGNACADFIPLHAGGEAAVSTAEQVGIPASCRDEPKARHQPTTPGEQGEG